MNPKRRKKRSKAVRSVNGLVKVKKARKKKYRSSSGGSPISQKVLSRLHPNYQSNYL
jgi:hypothetical protein